MTNQKWDSKLMAKGTTWGHMTTWLSFPLVFILLLFKIQLMALVSGSGNTSGISGCKTMSRRYEERKGLQINIVSLTTREITNNRWKCLNLILTCKRIVILLYRFIFENHMSQTTQFYQFRGDLALKKWHGRRTAKVWDECKCKSTGFPKQQQITSSQSLVFLFFLHTCEKTKMFFFFW